MYIVRFPLHLSLVWRHACNSNWSTHVLHIHMTHEYDSYRMNKCDLASVSLLYIGRKSFFFVLRLILHYPLQQHTMFTNCIESPALITHISTWYIVNGSTTRLLVVLESIFGHRKDFLFLCQHFDTVHTKHFGLFLWNVWHSVLLFNHLLQWLTFSLR